MAILRRLLDIYVVNGTPVFSRSVNHDTSGGFITRNLDRARAEHAERGGYLILIGQSPDQYAVCTREQAVDSWGRTEADLDALAPSYSEVE